MNNAILASGAATRHRHHYSHREWQGHGGRRYCRKPDGAVGTVLGAAGGALAGHALDSNTHCR